MILTSLGRLMHSIAPRLSYNELAKTTLLASTLTALGLIIALAVLLPPSAPAEAQTSPADATPTPTGTATPTPTADPNATATPTATPTGTATPTPTTDPNATATPTATPTGTATPTPTTDPDATATPTGTATATATATATPTPTGTATGTATPTPTATSTVPPANADYDFDNDGLIEIRTLAQLNAVRHDLDGDGKQDSVSAADWTTYTTAFLNAASDMGCPLTDHDDDATTDPQPTCEGYELMMDLNFDTNRDGEVNSSDTYPNWTPIGAAASPFNATFKGSLTNDVMPKISNLTISGASTEAGLFGATGSNARIESVGLAYANVNITTSAAAKIGALVGSNSGKIIACYSTGAITANAGAASYAGGLIGHQTANAATTASFSRATVSMSIDPAVTDANRMYIYAGGLMGHNSGTITAAYAGGAVKGKGGSSSFIGGLVGDNNGTITASYSIAPVTAAAGSVITPGGLLGYNDRTNGSITASYWDYISSGIDDDADTAMPEGKSTSDLTSPISFDTGIYADWDDLTIDGATDVDPWVIDSTRFHPLLTYGGHATARSGNQLFVNSGIDSRYGGNAIHPREGMTLYTSMGSYGDAFRGLRYGWTWEWQTSTDGIDWTTLTPLTRSAWTIKGAWGSWRFIPRAEHVGKYFRAKMLLKDMSYAYTRVIGKIKAASLDAPLALSFASGHNPPRIGTAITVASLPNSPTSRPVVGLWYRCDTVDDTPSSPGCELVGSLDEYTPGGADLDHYIRAYIYYKDDGVWKRASPGVTTQQVAEVQRVNPWRER